MIEQKAFRECGFIIKVLVLLLVFTGFSNSNYAQDDIIRVDTNLVMIPVSVVDREGRYVANLKKEDFQIFEDGVEQEVAILESVEKTVTVFLLLDRSGSMSNFMSELTRAANTFVLQLRPNDQIIAATFADYVDVLFKPTKVKDLQYGVKIRQHKGDSYTRTYDAVGYTLERMKKIKGRRAIILFSDGAGEGTFDTFKSNMRDAEESDTLIYTVQFDTFPRVISSKTNKKAYIKSIEVANSYMRNLAQVTGGRAYQIEKIDDLEQTFKLVADELGQQYSIGYYPKQSGEQGERKQIKVKVNLPNAAVRARDSYIVGNSKK